MLALESSHNSTITEQRSRRGGTPILCEVKSGEARRGDATRDEGKAVVDRKSVLLLTDVDTVVVPIAARKVLIDVGVHSRHGCGLFY